MWAADIREEIVEIFQEAQHPLLDKFTRWRVRFAEFQSSRRREGFNRKRRESALYARQRARYTHWKIKKKKPPTRAALQCSACGYRAHTAQQLSMHRYWHEKRQDPVLTQFSIAS